MIGVFGQLLLDTNVLISASKKPFIPEDQECLKEILAYVKPANVGHVIDCNRDFWVLLAHANALEGMVASLDVVRAEVLRGNDHLISWARNVPEEFFAPSSDGDIDENYDAVLTAVKARPQFSVRAIDKFVACADSRLIAYAKTVGATVVTLEKRRDDSTSIVSIPTVCAWEDIACMNTSGMLRRLKDLLLPRDRRK